MADIFPTEAFGGPSNPDAPVDAIMVFEAARAKFATRAEFEEFCEEMLSVAGGEESAAISNPQLVSLLRQAAKHTDITDLADDLVDLADATWGTDWDVRGRP